MLKVKQFLCIILVVCLLFSSIYIAEAIPAVNYQGQYGPGGYLYATARTQLPNGVDWRNKNSVPLNLDILKQLNITVYGYYGSIKSVTNDFKKGSNITEANDNSGYDPNKGTYYNNGVWGEYRYHGYTHEGNLYTNAKFPVDVAMKKPVSAYKYMYRRWERGATYFDGTASNDLNKVATEKVPGMSPANVNTAQKTIRTILINGDFSADGRVLYGIGGSTSDSSRYEAYNYANVLTAPDHFTAGQVELRHLGSDGKKYYVDIVSNPTTIDKQVLKVNTKFDTGTVSNNTSVLKKGDNYVVNITLKATYDDKNYHKDKIRKHLYYTRNDISHWVFEIYDDITGKTQTITVKPNGNIAEYRFTVTMPASAYEKRMNNNKFDFMFTGKSTVYFYDTGDSAFDSDIYSKGAAGSGGSSGSDPAPVMEAKVPAEPITTITFTDNKPIKVNIVSPEEMLDTEMFKLSENTEYTNVRDVRVYLDGDELSTFDARTFLNGEWLFDMKGYDDLYNYRVEYSNELGMTFLKQATVKVYTTKPNAQIVLSGIQKENRALTARNNMGASNLNTSYFLSRATLSTTNFSITGDNVYINYQDGSKIEFLDKKAWEDIVLQLDIRATVNSVYIERNDIPVDYHSGQHIYKLQVVPDYKPAIISNIWNPVLARNEDLSYMLDICSTDGDNISVNTYSIYFDENNDGIPEKLVQSGDASSFAGYKPTLLGEYKLVLYAEESFGESTYSKFITTEDKRTSVLEKTFTVKNLAPQTEIYVDIPIAYPQVDIMILNDQGISRDLNNNILGTRIDFMNNLIRSGLSPDVQIWDLYTYIYSQSASTTKNTGTSSPSASVPYESNGYSGTLSLIKTENNFYNGIIGHHMEEMSDTITGSGYSKQSWSKKGGYKSSSTNKSSIKSGGRTYDKVDWWEEGTTREETTDPKTGEVIAWSEVTTYGALYEATWTVRVTDYGDIDDYTGYYNGTIYKSIKQQFTPIYRNNSNKYIVYFADSVVNNLSDYQVILNKADYKIITIGNTAVKNDSRIRKDLYIDSSKSLTVIQDEIIQYISKDNPQERGLVVLANDSFTVNFADVDLEGDPIQPNGFQVVHNQNYFDNPTGQEVNTTSSFNENGYILSSLPNKLAKSGEYTFYRRIKDAPIQRPEASEISNNAEIKIYVHRKPIAKFTLDWTFVPANGWYTTTWVDTSYDPDLQFKDTEGTKGIRERKIKYRQLGAPEWIYAIPDKLIPANYEVEYIVKDNFGIWSDPFTMTFDLPVIPPAQIKAKLKPQLDVFSLASVPASENLIAYDIWTRYPFDVKLQLALYNDATQVSQLKEVIYSASTGTKSGQDIFWNDIMYNIPATLRNQLYIMKIRALDTAIPERYAELDFSVTVNTPINLVPNMNSKIMAERDVEIKATTSKYVDSAYWKSGVKVILFDGTSYEKTLTLNGRTTNWSLRTNQPKAIPEGIYTARFIATLPSGETEVKILQYQYLHNTPPVINGGDVFADLKMDYIYENDDVNYTLSFNDLDLTALSINIKLYKSSNMATPIKEYNKTVIPNGIKYDDYTLRLIDDITIGDYVLKATVVDDYNETATLTTSFTAHDLWIKGEVTHTPKWEENRQTYNNKYTTKSRDINTYWNGESFETSAETTVININSNVVCNKVSIEIINEDSIWDNSYLQWLVSENKSNDKWKLSYWDKEWVNKNGYVITKWGQDKKQELTLRFTAYFNNDWKETFDIKIFIDSQDDYWKLHRAW